MSNDTFTQIMTMEMDELSGIFDCVINHILN
jgi:hypothetical protein